jgi:hypothetical protein
MKMKNLLLTAIAVFGIATTTLAQLPSYVPTNGLVGYWPFNGNANDESINGNNGTVNGATLTINRFGSTNAAYSFNGVSNYIECMQSGPIGVPSITVAFWTKNIGSGSGHIVSWGNNGISGEDFRVLTNAYGTCASSLGFDIYNSGIAFDNTFSSNSWDFYVVIFDSSIGTNINAASVYKNGVQIGLTCFNQNNSSINISSAFPICFGKYHGTIPTDYLSGIVDDIGIWNRVLTQQEITDLYAGCQLSINTQPSNQQININNNAQFVVGSSDPSATFQWQTDLGVGFQNLNSVGQYSGTNTNTLTVSNVTMSNNNQPFRCIISSGSCSDTSNVAVLNVNNNVGINEFTQNNLFSVYPNPAHSQINIKADATLLGSIFTVYDNTGKVVLSGKIISENTTIELGNLSGGIYLFSVGENLKQTFKVIKE